MKEIHINANDAGQRLDKFLQKACPSLTKGMMYKALRNKKIKVNRKRAAYDQILMENDTILLFLPPDALEGQRSRKLDFSGSQKLDIVYEDDDLLIVNKPKGLLCQKDSGGQQDTLAQRIVNYLYATGQYDPQKEASFIPSIAHRLDRNTSGLVAAAKNAPALRKLNKAIHDHTLKKYYLAQVEGIPPEGPVRLYLKKEGTLAVISDTPADGYDPADMEIRVLKTQDGISLAEIWLQTGRFHQIRACMSHLGHPVVGDHKYGYKGPVKDQRLQAWKLDFSGTELHPDPLVIEAKKEI